MANLVDVGDSVELLVPARGTDVSIAISGTYVMTLFFQVEQGAPGSGAWQTINTYDTVDGTEAAVYTTASWNEKCRIIVDDDTSGTAAATLADNSDLALKGDVVDSVGNKLITYAESGTTFVQGVGGPAIVNETSSALTVTKALHAGRVVTLNRAAGVACTLPLASGSGDVYTFFIGTTNTSVGYVVKASSSADSFGGGVALATDIAGVVILCDVNTDTITMGGSDTTTGGVIGGWVRMTDVAVGKYMCEGFIPTVGTEATPFSAGV